jgi:hypothetical protein
MEPVAELVYESLRRFEVWDWGPGHRGLLLRSHPTEETPSRIEIWFKPGYAVCLPSYFEAIQVTRGGSALPDDAVNLLGRPAEDWEEFFIVDTSQGTGWVLAGGVHGREDDRAFHEPAMFDGKAPGRGVRSLFSVTRRMPRPGRVTDSE